MNAQKIRELATAFHHASARAISNDVSRGGVGYSLSIGQCTEIITSHIADEEKQPTPDKSLEDAVNEHFSAQLYGGLARDCAKHAILTYTASLQQRYNDKHDAFIKALKQYEATHVVNVQLRKELEEANRDKERLEWLEVHRSWWNLELNCNLGLRAAIDAALRKNQAK